MQTKIHLQLPSEGLEGSREEGQGAKPNALLLKEMENLEAVQRRRQHRLEWQRKHYHANKEKYRASRKISCARSYQRNKHKHKDRQREYDRKRYAANREHELARYKAYAARKPEKIKELSWRRYLRGWGITQTSYDAMLSRQNGVCAICCKPCKSGRRLAIDHCHRTGKIRGLLCANCNCGIGNFFESEALITSAINYLRNHQTNNTPCLS